MHFEAGRLKMDINELLKNLKEIEKSFKDNKEMERIAKIMKNTEPLKSQKFYETQFADNEKGGS